MEEANVLIEDDLESIEEPEGLHRGAHLDEVVVRVRSPDVDLLVEAAIPKRFEVVRDVLAQIAGLAVRAHEDPAFGVLHRLAGLEPDRAVPFVNESKRAELRKSFVESTRAHHPGLREPRVVADAKHRGDPLRLAQHPAHAVVGEARGLLLEPQAHPLVSVAVLDLARDVLHVLGWIGVVRDLDGLAVELSIPDRDRTPEGLELSARVLDVVLALHPRASELED